MLKLNYEIFKRAKNLKVLFNQLFKTNNIELFNFGKGYKIIFPFSQGETKDLACLFSYTIDGILHVPRTNM